MSNDIELSPGFFDLNNEDDNENIIPDKINVENDENNNNNNNENNNNENNNDENNVVIDFFTMLIIAQKPCDCQTGWSRTSTY